MTLILWAVFGYLLGSVPFGLVITRALGLGDLRQIGSGNIGATNVLRTGNKPAALATLLLDSGKGAIAVLLARHLGGETAALLAGGAAFLGHCFPVWLRFKGGKGVATFLGTLLALHWPLGLIACAIWAVTALISRISSLSALLAAALAPVFAWGMGRMDLGAVAGFMAILIALRHHANITRLLNGTEPRIGRKQPN
ncbi:glycerol-3-phosphate 1-O-acyltransferase PlsY [Paracoccus sp. (in: a-proteobacteria)]|uniref:glycerol-3-phosphate 1-O-acyltransferase PlsY n=1 Tax=Paracoccus sp. TaxID=267 RepID=UPI00396CC05D